ncbi:MAG TPA: hypothetical protein VFE30_10245 [Anaeromyxobacteraceae bacterium]|nr:hypothetical protein [Anaeromyxobacteraceae bacterium]
MKLVDEKAVAAGRDGTGFVVETERGQRFRGGAVVLSTGVMDRQPSVKLTTKSGKVIDDIRWIYPWANAESLLYCILCEGHLVRGTPVAVFGASEAAAQVALLLHERYGVAVTLHRVYNDLARQLGAELDPADGPEEVRHVLVEDATSETSVRGLFAVGDMSRHRGGTPSLKQIYTAQEYAVRAVQAIDRRERAARRAHLLDGR